jgi:hypothetical protein
LSLVDISFGNNRVSISFQFHYTFRGIAESAGKSAKQTSGKKTAATDLAGPQINLGNV